MVPKKKRRDVFWMGVSGVSSIQLQQLQASMLAAAMNQQQAAISSVNQALSADLSFMGIGLNINLQA